MRQGAALLSRSSWLSRTLLLFAALAIVSTLGAWPIVRVYNAGRVEVIEAREKGYAEAAALEIEAGLREILGDLRVVARLPAMKQYLNQPGVPEREQALTAACEAVMEAYGRYSQIRLLDLGGREVLRVDDINGRAIVVPREKLQDKSDRYYFKAAANLDRDQVYVSPLDLNVENGKIEVPYQPTLRVAMPVYDAADNKKLILIFNVQASDLLDRFREIMKAEPLHQAMLLDHDGYWLSGGVTSDEWGFMFGRNDATFGNMFPAEWSSVVAGDHGVLRTDQGLFIYSSVHSPASGATRDPYYLKIVLLIPQRSLQRLLIPHLPLGQALFAAVYVLLLVLAGLSAYISLYLKRTREVERAVAREIEDLYERAPCGYHSLDRNGLIVRMNQTELNWLGYRRDEIVGKKKATDLMNEDGRRIFAERFPQLVESGFVGNIEFDFVRKDGSLLPVSVNASVVRDDDGNFVMSRSTVFDATERRSMERELMRRANTDPLTGIGNRRHFFELAEHELSRGRRTSSPLSLLLIDIDNFKQINDRFGHDAGDAVLKEMTASCAAVLRDVDVFARVGGEEFAVLLPDTDGVQARNIAERLRERLEAVSVSRAQGPPLRFTVSIGVASLNSSDATESIYAILQRADAALYQAKNAGRNRVRASA